MKIEQIYTGCLAHGAYYIESNGEVAIIDPLREVTPYIERAVKNNSKIKYILETHFHADFISGHLDLAKQTGATIVYGPTAKPDFEALVAKDDELLKLGNITIKVLHCPGHTMESSCFLLIDEKGNDYALFSGDTLFIGDVGRPDLAQLGDLTQEKLAGFLYDSLRNKVMPISDEVIVYPGHGAGSACGKMMSSETTDSLGHQKQFNYALRADMTKEEFVKEVLTGLMPPPQYFPKNARMNKMGYESIDKVFERGTNALTVDAFEAVANEPDVLILDTRAPKEFIKSFIPNSINIGVDGQFAPWVGALIPDLQQKILLVTDPGREHEVITRLARVGYDYAIGYLDGGFKSWLESGKETDSITSVTVDEFAKAEIQNPEIKILDVRKKSEYNTEHIINAENVPLDYINDNFNLIDKNQTYYVHCAGGYRSVIYISILKARGYNNLIDVNGGFNAIKKTEKFKMSDFKQQTTML